MRIRPSMFGGDIPCPNRDSLPRKVTNFKTSGIGTVSSNEFQRRELNGCAEILYSLLVLPSLKDVQVIIRAPGNDNIQRLDRVGFARKVSRFYGCKVV